MSGEATQAESLLPSFGSVEVTKQPEKLEPRWVPIGVLYAKLEKGIVTFEVFYESHTEQIVKDEIAQRFGAGAREWRVCAER